jgi:hypothetical protein
MFNHDAYQLYFAIMEVYLSNQVNIKEFIFELINGILSYINQNLSMRNFESDKS